MFVRAGSGARAAVGESTSSMFSTSAGEAATPICEHTRARSSRVRWPFPSGSKSRQPSAITSTSEPSSFWRALTRPARSTDP